MPGQVEREVAGRHADAIQPRPEFIEFACGALQARRVANDTDFVPHYLIQRLADRVEIAGGFRQRRAAARGSSIDSVLVGLVKSAVRLDPLRHHVAGDAAEHRRIRHAVAAETVRAMHAARIFACDEQTRQIRRAIRPERDTAHHVMRRRHHIDQAGHEIKAAVGAALDHAPEHTAHHRGIEMAHRDIQPAARPDPPRAHFLVHAAAHDVARRALAARIVVVHEALAGAVKQIAADPAQTLLDDSAGDARMRSCHQPGRMKLHHFHVTQRKPGSERHRHAVARLVARRRVKLVHGRPAAGGEQHGLRLHEHEFAAAHVYHQHAGKRITCLVLHELDRAVLLEPVDAARPHLFGKPVDDFDAGQIAFVHGAVERLPRERLLVNRAIGIAVEKATQFVLELVDALHRY